MIPSTIQAPDRDDDCDSQLSDDDDAAILKAAMHFGGSLLDSESKKPANFSTNDPSIDYRQNRRGYSGMFEAGSQDAYENSGVKQVVTASYPDSRTLSKAASTTSSSNSERTLRRNNVPLNKPAGTNLSIKVPPVYCERGKESPNSPLSSFNGMSQIVEENASSGGTKNVPTSQGSCGSHTEPSTMKTELSVQQSSISSYPYLEESAELDSFRSNEDLPRESQRLSGSMQPISFMDARSSLRMSGKKRRSNAESMKQEIDEAAAFVAKLYAEGDFSDHDDDGPTMYHEQPSSSRETSRRSSARSQVSGPGLSNTGFTEERPRKRLSSKTQHSAFNTGIFYDDATNAGVKTQLKSIPGTTTIAKADHQSRISINTDNRVENHKNTKNRNGRAQRRKAFVVPTFQREAGQQLADRMKLLEKDRIENRVGRHGARRSMSYTSGIKLKSNIIGTSLPEDAEAALSHEASTAAQEVQTNPDFQKLRMNRVQRRVNSMPDPNAVQRLSESAVNTDVDFSVGPHFDAAIAEPRQSLPSTWQPTHGITNNLFNNMRPVPPPSPIQPMPPPTQAGFLDSPFCTNSTFGTSISTGNLSMASSSLGSANQYPAAQTTFAKYHDDIDREIQHLIARTNEATQVFAQIARSNSNILSNLRGPNRSAFDDDLFDGKESSVNAFEISRNSPSEYNTTILLHEACKKDDTLVVENILKNSIISTRHSLQGSEAGDTALHIAAQYGSNASTRLILDFDINCALIRNGLGYTPLHFAVDNGHLATAITLVTSVPECASIQCESGFLPLHDSVTAGADQMDTPQIMTALLHAFKNAVFVTNDEGLLPIHLAASSAFEIGIRTLLSSEFRTIYLRDKLEDMLPLDIAVQKLAEIISEEPSNEESDESDDATADIERNPIKANYIACIEILLSSMLYDRLIVQPRGNSEKPFLPLHSVIGAQPLIETWNTIFEVYGEEHHEDIDPIGCRNIAHKICSRPIKDIDNDLSILNSLETTLFLNDDKYGFIPLHLALQNRDAPFQFIRNLGFKDRISLSQPVKPILGNIYANFSPVQIAAASDCDLGIIYFLMRSHPHVITEKTKC